MTFKNSVSLLLCLVLLSACNFSPLDWVYSDRAKFTFMDDDEETQYVYLCKKDKDENLTKQRAEKAHQFFSEGITKISEKFVEDLLKQHKEDGESGNNSFTASIAAGLKLNNESEKLAAKLEENFQCLLTDTIDIEALE